MHPSGGWRGTYYSLTQEQSFSFQIGLRFQPGTSLVQGKGRGKGSRLDLAQMAATENDFFLSHFSLSSH